MFVNVSSITKQSGNIVLQEFNEILPKMLIVSSGHELSIYRWLNYEYYNENNFLIVKIVALTVSAKYWKNCQYRISYCVLLETKEYLPLVWVYMKHKAESII